MKTPAFLLVHGAWHGAWCFADVVAALEAAGHPARAIDLPGHGADARIPASFEAYDPAGLAREPSQAAGLTIDDARDRVVAEVARLRSETGREVMLVGHSAGGLAITAAGETAPAGMGGLIYLAAFMLPPGLSILDAYSLPENDGAEVPSLLVADPAAIGAQRIDPRSRDAAYGARLRSAFFADVDEPAAQAAIARLVPDEPLTPAPIATSAQRWGQIPRGYIVAEQDRAILPALQRRMIADVDTAFPRRRTVVRSLATSHSPFLSAPDTLAGTLIELARAL